MQQRQVVLDGHDAAASAHHRLHERLQLQDTEHAPPQAIYRRETGSARKPFINTSPYVTASTLSLGAAARPLPPPGWPMAWHSPR